MKIEKASKHKLKQLHQKRKQVAQLHVKSISIPQIVGMTGLSIPMVRNTINLYSNGGWPALRPKACDQEKEQGRLLTTEQELGIKLSIINNRPEQLKLDFYLWSRTAVMRLIEQEYGIKLSLRTVSKYLKRWNFRPQKPIKETYKQRPKTIQVWLNKRYATIAAKAKAKNGEVYWVNRTVLPHSSIIGNSHATPEKTKESQEPIRIQEKLSMIAAMSDQGKTHWMIINGMLNADKLIEFLNALIKVNDKKVFLILDDVSIHQAKPVKAWLAKRYYHIKVFNLPRLKAESNSKEPLNTNSNQVIGKQVVARTKTKFFDGINQLRFLLKRSMDSRGESLKDIPEKKPPEKVEHFDQDALKKLIQTEIDLYFKQNVAAQTANPWYGLLMGSLAFFGLFSIFLIFQGQALFYAKKSVSLQPTASSRQMPEQLYKPTFPKNNKSRADSQSSKMHSLSKRIKNVSTTNNDKKMNYPRVDLPSNILTKTQTKDMQVSIKNERWPTLKDATSKQPSVKKKTDTKEFSSIQAATQLYPDWESLAEANGTTAPSVDVQFTSRPSVHSQIIDHQNNSHAPKQATFSLDAYNEPTTQPVPLKNLPRRLKSFLPKMRVNGIVHLADTQDSYVFINMKKYRVDEVIENGPSITEIRQNSVVMEYHGIKFILADKQ